MKTKGAFTKSKRYLIIALFLVAIALSVVLAGKVGINYNISDYLEEDTETKISLEIIENEFGTTSDIQVMVEGIDADAAVQLASIIKNVDNVLTVNFDVNDERYYKNETALVIALVNGDEYSAEANAVVENIKSALSETYGENVNYGGGIAEKANLREAIEGEIPFILAISVCLVIAIMLLTSKSWIEPIVLLFASGIAILINMGTNVIFGEISYITNAVAAILQLALSVDYSIVLLHGYRKIKETESDHAKAMAMAVRQVLSPISASALTTIAGLLALLFMSMRIGFDIGIVLMKGIVISALVSLTLLPVLLLLLEKILAKTAKRELEIKGKLFGKLAFKASKVVAPIALALIIVCGALQFGNTYTFTDSQKSNSKIADVFGRNNTVVVVYPNNEHTHANEKEFAQMLSAYKTGDGKYALKNYTAYSNTVRQLYDVELASRKLNLPESDVEMLFTMYHLYGDHALVKLKPYDFVSYANELVTDDADMQEFAGEDLSKTLRTLLLIEQMMNGRHTAEEFHALVSTGLMAEAGLSLFAIKQMYGLYFYDDIEEKSVQLGDMIAFAADAAANGTLDNFIDEDTAQTLSSLPEKIGELTAPMTRSEFGAYMREEQGVTLSAAQIDILFAAYFADQSNVVGEKIQLLSLMNYLVESEQITDPETIALIEELNRMNLDAPMTKQEFGAYMLDKQGIALTDSQLALIYAAYFADAHDVTEETIPFLSLMNYLVESGQITDADAIAGVGMLNQAALIKKQVLTTTQFQAYMRDEYGVTLSDLEVSMIYVGYFNSQGTATHKTEAPLLPVLTYMVSAGHITDPETVALIDQLNALDLDAPMTQAAFKAYMLEEQGVTLEDAQIALLYAAYFANENDVVGETIPFLSLMNYLVEVEQITDADAVAGVEILNDLDRQMTQTEFGAYMLDKQGIALEEAQLSLIYAAYFAKENDVVGETIPFLSLMNYLVETEQVTDADAIATVNGCNVLLAAISCAYTYDELLVLFEEASELLAGEPVTLGFDDNAIQQLYILYFYEQGNMPLGAINGEEFVRFVMDTAASNSVVGAQLSSDALLRLQDLFVVDAFMSEDTAYDFDAMTQRVNALQGDISSLPASSTLGSGTVSGVYIKYAIGNEYALTDAMEAQDLLAFIVENMSTNDLLKVKISEENRAKVEAAQDSMASAKKLFVGENYSRMLLTIDLPSESEESSKFVAYLLPLVKDVFGENAHIAGEMISTYDLQQAFDADNMMITIFTIISIFLIVMLIFRSLSLPIILVAVIQGAVWITMSMSLVTGPVFFMSYIIATCILMGATIDYGILMSSNYVQNRRFLDKKESLYKSLEAAMPTVFTSGVILTICGFVIGLISSQGAIATVGMLIGKGTLVSVVMITFVLPSVLYLLDGFIMKLSMAKKDKKQ